MRYSMISRANSKHLNLKNERTHPSGRMLKMLPKASWYLLRIKHIETVYVRRVIQVTMHISKNST